MIDNGAMEWRSMNHGGGVGNYVAFTLKFHINKYRDSDPLLLSIHLFNLYLYVLGVGNSHRAQYKLTHRPASSIHLFICGSSGRELFGQLPESDFFVHEISQQTCDAIISYLSTSL